MPILFKKVLVLLPVVLLGLIYVYDHGSQYDGTSNKRLLFLALSLFILYAWAFLEASLRKQNSYFDIAAQASFFLYVFMILALTGYFSLFREIAGDDWWHKMMSRIDRRDHVNLKLFQIFRIYKNTDTQIFGNLIMLFPLGIYVPLLYPKLSNFFVTVFACFVVALLIECVQLATKYRSADVDDIFLNTIGAGAGALVFMMIHSLFKWKRNDGSATKQPVEPLA